MGINSKEFNNVQKYRYIIFFLLNKKNVYTYKTFCSFYPTIKYINKSIVQSNNIHEYEVHEGSLFLN